MARASMQLIRSSNSLAKYCLARCCKLQWISSRKHTSVLYVSGRHAKESFSYVTPCIDMDNKLSNIEEFQQELNLRGLNIDVKELKKSWDFYKSVYKMTSDLEQNVSELKDKLKKLRCKQDKTENDEKEIEKLTIQYDLAKDNFKQVRESLWDLDDSVIQKLMKLPNRLDKKTPYRSSTVVKTIGTLHEAARARVKSHIEIGSNLGILEYKNPMQYYLFNEGALFELGVLGYAGSVFKEDEMVRVSNSDFARSFVVEGGGHNHENLSDAFLLANHCEVKEHSRNGMHLVGGASLISFLALHTKQLINPKHFPLRYFAAGRQYAPLPENTIPKGLFTVCQSSAVHTFILVKDESSEEYSEQFDSLTETICKLYGNICDHYRVVLRSAPELEQWEKLRLSFELWSPFLKQYIEVGHLSLCGDYFSKRLLTMYKTPKDKDYTSAICGTVLSVPRLMGCLLEQNPDKFSIPSKVAEYMPIDR